MSQNRISICVIGSGASGLPSIKSCIEEGFHVICYEKTDQIGGLWRYRNQEIEGVSKLQKSTISNSSKEINSFSDFPIPKEFPNYLHNTKMSEYFELYAQKFGLLSHIMFEHSVIKVEKNIDYESTHKWKVSVSNDRENLVFTKVFDGVMVCTGHHAIPRWPQFPGQELFKGEIMHSRSFKYAIGYENKTAVVVGIGNSGCDAATELSFVCDNTYLAVRRGGWINHRIGSNGIPNDHLMIRRFTHKLMSYLPFSLICWYFETFHFNERFDHQLYGIQPDFRCFSQDPIVSDILPNRIISGRIIVKKNIERFVENGVIFVGDKKVTKCDLVVMATGYHYKFPILDESILKQSDDNRIKLYKQVFPEQLSHPSLALIGAVQPNSSVFPIIEMQTRWYALLMAGKCHLPSSQEMAQDIELATTAHDAIYYRSPRNAIAVDWIDYMDEIAKMIGVYPDFRKYLLSDPRLLWKLVFGTTLSYHYRLDGPHSWSGARNAIIEADNRIKFALLPNQNQRLNSFCLNANSYRIIISFILFLFAFFIFDLID